jgi:uncharacterized protein YjbI with pentapeptide repeats
LWIIGMVVALLTTALLILNLYPEIWKGLLEERNLKLMVIGVSVTAIIVLLAIGGAASRWTGFRGMTVRDWLDLLVVPLALVVISFLFTTQQDQRQQEIENQRAAAERELAVERAQDEALQAYLAQMSTLMLEKDLRNSEENSEQRTLARARTLTVLGRLDPRRKTALMQFLVEADLVQRVDGREPIISLRGADLRDAVLFDTDLSGANLMEANLNDAILSASDLSEANLSEAYLRDATLDGTNLRNANLTVAFLERAFLSRAKLSDAALTFAYLRDATLFDANLSGADLEGANLNDASGITNKELEQQAKFLGRATMPNGQKYEDWLKDRENRQQDE